MKTMLVVPDIILYCLIIISSCCSYQFRHAGVYRRHILSKIHSEDDDALKGMPSFSSSIGFAKSMGTGYSTRTHLISGENAIEHGINMIEHAFLTGAKSECPGKVLVISGWNSARVDPLMWELEPRGFVIDTATVSDEPTIQDIISIFEYALLKESDTIIAMGGASVMDASKLVCTMLEAVAEATACQTSSMTSIRSILQMANYTLPQGTNVIKRVQLVTIPTLPRLGGEMSQMASVIVTRSSNTEVPPHHNQRFHFKYYVPTVSPSLCLLQPSVLTTASMELLHRNIVCVLGLAVDTMLSATNSVSEMLAWSALEKLLPVFDAAVLVAQNRHTSRFMDPVAFEEITVHDDLDSHDSQFFRRFGTSLSSTVIAQLNDVSAVLGTARASPDMPPTPLQFLADTAGISTADSSPFSARLCFLAPRYLLSVLDWAEETITTENDSHPLGDKTNTDTKEASQDVFSHGLGVGVGGDYSDGKEVLLEDMSREDRRRMLRDGWKAARSRSGVAEDLDDRAATRSKLAQLAALWSRSQFLSDGGGGENGDGDGDGGYDIRSQLHLLQLHSRSISGPEVPGQNYRLPQIVKECTPRDCRAVRQTLRSVCGDVPGSHLSVEQIYSLFLSFEETAFANNGSTDLKQAGPPEDEEDEDEDEDTVQIASLVAVGEEMEMESDTDGEGEVESLVEGRSVGMRRRLTELAG